MKYDYIVRVAEAKSISQAAKELYISQPALTKYINNLEDELGVKLFNRKTIPLYEKGAVDHRSDCQQG